MCSVMAVSGKRQLPMGRIREGEEAKVCSAALCSWTHRRGEQFQNRSLTRFRIAFYFSQTRCRVCMWRSGSAFWGESVLSVNRVGPGSPNQVIRLGDKRLFPTGLSHWPPAKEDVGVFGGASTP